MSAPMALVATKAAKETSSLALSLHPQAQPDAAGSAVIKVHFAAVNPSDVKACLGLMPSARFPRTTGRDFAGTVVAGPEALVGLEVWGTGGDIGISRDGSHASYLRIEPGAVRQKPARLTMEEAAGVGVPFVTAMQGFAEAGGIRPGETVLVFGANGKVGQAAVQIALWHSARVIAVTRGRQSELAYLGNRFQHVDATDGEGLEERLRAAVGPKGADIIYNTVGSAYWSVALPMMGKRARQIFIATQDRAVPFDIFAFYRGRHQFFGVDSLALDCRASGELLERLKPGFESGDLKPFPIEPGAVHPLGDWAAVYADVLAGARRRTLFDCR